MSEKHTALYMHGWEENGAIVVSGCYVHLLTCSPFLHPSRRIQWSGSTFNGQGAQARTYVRTKEQEKGARYT